MSRLQLRAVWWWCNCHVVVRQAALLQTLANISAQRDFTFAAVGSGTIFDALACCLRDFEAHEGVVEGVASVTHHLLEDEMAARTLQNDAELPAALVRVARIHAESSPRVALPMLRALVRVAPSAFPTSRARRHYSRRHQWFQ